jgi:uroporphyrinogen-III decarboxylase
LNQPIISTILREAVAVDAVGLDWTVELGFARDQVQARRPVQGNLDPLALLTGGAPLDRSIDAILEALAGGPFIFQSRPRHPAGNVALNWRELIHRL